MLQYKLSRWIFAVTLFLTFGSSSMAQDPLTILGAGWTVDQVINKASDKIEYLLGVAAGNSSLVISKGARDGQLLMEATRQELHDELNTQWDKLDSQKVSLLRELDKTLGQIEQLGVTASRIEDTVVLDIDGEIDRLPFTKTTPSIRRLAGGTQYCKSSGAYRIVFTTNLVTLAKGQQIEVTLNHKTKLPASAIIVNPPYNVAVTIPASQLTFDKAKLSYVPIELTATVNSNRGWYELWKPADRSVTLPAKLELFPIDAVSYSLTEWRAVPTVIRDRLEIQKGPDWTVPGCGDSGCNAYHPFCVGVPAGGVPVDYINLRDTFNGWGGWGPPSASGTQVCATYWQHSHNQSRNVGFDARYYPLEQVRSSGSVTLQKIDAGTPNTCDASGQSAEIGSTYNAIFSDQYVSYDLAVKTFTGETVVATPAQAPNGQIVAVSALENSTTFKRMTVTFKLPW